MNRGIRGTPLNLRDVTDERTPSARESKKLERQWKKGVEISRNAYAPKPRIIGELKALRSSVQKTIDERHSARGISKTLGSMFVTFLTAGVYGSGRVEANKGWTVLLNSLNTTIDLFESELPAAGEADIRDRGPAESTRPPVSGRGNDYVRSWLGEATHSITAEKDTAESRPVKERGDSSYRGSSAFPRKTKIGLMRDIVDHYIGLGIEIDAKVVADAMKPVVNAYVKGEGKTPDQIAPQFVADLTNVLFKKKLLSKEIVPMVKNALEKSGINVTSDLYNVVENELERLKSRS